MESPVSLREALATIGAAGYDRRGTLNQPVFGYLNLLAEEIQDLVPGHYLVPVSHGLGALPVGLWVSILDPDVTTSSTRGTYVVYLFNEVRDRVSLSLNQGVTNAREAAQQDGIGVRELLRRQGSLMRHVLAGQTVGLEEVISLGRGGLLPAYEAGNALAKTWPLAALPSSDELANELLRFLDMYAQVVPAIEHIRASGGTGTAPPRASALAPDERERRFEPKDSSDYRAHIGEHEQVRSRPHVKLVTSLGQWVAGRGYEPNENVHPIDLLLHGPGQDLLVEVKVFPIGRGRRPLRECVGQLFEYRHFYYNDSTGLVAALSANPGPAYLQLLSALGVAAMWTVGKRWEGTTMARKYGLVD